MLPAAIAPGISPKASTPIPRDWAQRMINLSYIQMISIETVAVPITKVRIRLDRIMRTPAVKSLRFSGGAAVPDAFSSAGSPIKAMAANKNPAASNKNTVSEPEMAKTSPPKAGAAIFAVFRDS